MLSSLYADKEDFLASLDKGIALVKTVTPPPPHRHDDLKALLSLFITATIEMDPKAFADPELPLKIAGVRLALCKAYDMGRKDAAKDT